MVNNIDTKRDKSIQFLYNISHQIFGANSNAQFELLITLIDVVNRMRNYQYFTDENQILVLDVFDTSIVFENSDKRLSLSCKVENFIISDSTNWDGSIKKLASYIKYNFHKLNRETYADLMLNLSIIYQDLLTPTTEILGKPY